MHFIPAAATRTAQVLPENQIARLQLTPAYHPVMGITPLRLSGCVGIHRRSQINIDLVYAPVHEPRAIELGWAFCAPYIRRAELRNRYLDNLRAFGSHGKIGYDLREVCAAVDIDAQQSGIVRIIRGRHHFVQHFPLILREPVQIGGLLIGNAFISDIDAQRGCRDGFFLAVPVFDDFLGCRDLRLIAHLVHIEEDGFELFPLLL